MGNPLPLQSRKSITIEDIMELSSIKNTTELIDKKNKKQRPPSASTSFSNVFRTIIKILCVMIIVPILSLVLTPIYIARFLVFLLSKVLRPDLVTILKVRDTFYAIDDIYSNPKSSVVVTLIFSGKMSKELLISKMSTITSKKMDGFKNTLLYPELKQYLVKWLGFFFWKEDKDFSYENHVQYIYENEFSANNNFSVMDEKFLNEIERVLVQEPFLPNHSPWAIKLLQNYKKDGEEHTCLFFKIHHSFVDGYSILNLLMKEICDADYTDMPMARFPKYNFIVKFLLSLIILLKTPYDAFTELISESDKNAWWLPASRITNRIKSSISPKIPTTTFKLIAESFDVSFNAVIISAISGGVRKFMQERNEVIDENTTFNCLCPFPVPNHPDTLGNHLSDCSVSLPIGIEDLIERLNCVEEQFESLKKSTHPWTNFAFQPFLGALFPWMVKRLVEISLSKCTGILSSFPAPKKTLFCGPHHIVDAYFTGGHDDPGIGVQFLSLSYNGGWRIKVQADEGSLKSDAEVEKLVSYIYREINLYTKLAQA